MNYDTKRQDLKRCQVKIFFRTMFICCPVVSLAQQTVMDHVPLFCFFVCLFCNPPFIIQWRAVLSLVSYQFVHRWTESKQQTVCALTQHVNGVTLTHRFVYDGYDSLCMSTESSLVKLLLEHHPANYSTSTPRFWQSQRRPLNSLHASDGEHVRHT